MDLCNLCSALITMCVLDNTDSHIVTAARTGVCRYGRLL